MAESTLEVSVDSANTNPIITFRSRIHELKPTATALRTPTRLKANPPCEVIASRQTSKLETSSALHNMS